LPLSVSAFTRAWDRGFERLEHAYGRLLAAALPKRWLVIGIGLLTFAAGISLPVLGFIGNDFFPSGDQSEMDITLTMPPATSLDATDSVARQMEADLRTMPEVRGLYTVIGTAGNSSSPNTAQIAALMVPPRERHSTAAEFGVQL